MTHLNRKAFYTDLCPEESRKRFIGIVKHEYGIRRTGNVSGTDRWRIIALIGAGMGYQTHLPLGGEAADKIEAALVLDNTLRAHKDIKYSLWREKLSGKSLIGENNYKQAIADLTQSTGISGIKPDFEMRMEALCQGHAMEAAVRNELKALFSSRYNVNLSYELLAHLFEAHMLDGIVNFNFDEQLDDAIERNLRPAQYLRIVSDGDYTPNLTPKQDHGSTSKVFEQRRLYIKPHGTVNHPSSLRFRKVDYSFLPDGILNAIRELLRGKTIFLVAGFGMQSIEFNELIRREMLENALDPEFYFINKDSDLLKKLRGEVASELHPLPSELHGRMFLLNGNQGDPGKEAIRVLFQGIRKGLEGTAVVLPDRRFSEAVAHLFTNLMWDAQREAGVTNPCDQSEWLPVYLYLRTALALVAQIARQKGRINLEAQGDTRVGAIYRKYIESCRQQEQPVRSLADMCHDLRLINYTYVRQLFMVSTTDASTREDVTEWLIKALPRLIDKHGQGTPKVGSTSIPSLLTDKFKERYNGDGIEYLTSALNDLSSWSSKDIVHVPNNDVSVIYPGEKTHITRIEHWDALKAETRKWFNESWDELWVITEGGEWVFKEYGAKICERKCDDNIPIIRIIVKEGAEMSGKKPKDLATVVEWRHKAVKELDPSVATALEQFPLEVHYLPREQHNRMLTCWLKRGADKVARPLAAIYSHRSDEDTYISPVVIRAGEKPNESDADLKYIVTLFQAYRISAIARTFNIGLGRKAKKANIVDHGEGCRGVWRQIIAANKAVVVATKENPQLAENIPECMLSTELFE